MKIEKLQFAKQKDWSKIFLWSWNAFYSKKGCETITVDWKKAKKADKEKLLKGGSFTLDEKKKTVLIK